MDRHILVVAGSGKIRETLAAGMRRKGCTVTVTPSGTEALAAAQARPFDLAVIESRLPDLGAEQLRTQIRQARPGCRVLVLTSFGAVRKSPELLRFGAADYLVRADQIVELVAGATDPPQQTSPPTEKGRRALMDVVDVLVGLLELGDRFFGGSSHQAMRLARALAEEMGLDEDSRDEVVLGTLLRDIGKAAEAPGARDSGVGVTPEDMERMRGHVDATLRLLEHVEFPWNVLPVIRHHHERYDGQGYPDGLRGREIPMGARVVAVVDAWVAMTSERSHRTALTAEDAQAELVRLAGSQFDPEVVEILLRVLEKRSGPRSPREKPLVLLMDPDAKFRNLLKMRLLNEGIEVVTAAGADEALEAIVAVGPDLVLADVQTESSESFQLLREIREDEALGLIPFGFLSGRDDRVLKVRALGCGVDEFLVKSANLDEIVARIGNVLIRESARRREAGRPARRRGITGQLENFPLPDIVQTLAIGMKTACVTLASGRNRGKLWFEDGAVRHVQADEAEGESAFYDMVRWAGGTFVIEHGVRTRKRSVAHDTMFLLMEAFRLMDEESQPAEAPPEEPHEPSARPSPEERRAARRK